MEANKLYEVVLQVHAPWSVDDVQGIPSTKRPGKCDEIVVTLEHEECYTCPICGGAATRHDSRVRRWRHLDTCEAQTILKAEIPRVRCPEHGVHQVPIPWAEGHAPYTMEFESHVIDLLLEGTTSGVSRLVGIGWDSVNHIKQRAVTRGLARRKWLTPKHIGVDETSSKKRHDYVTIVSDQNRGVVLYVGDGKDSESLETYYKSLSEAGVNRIESVSMDMSPAYISATKKCLPQADTAICFDRFHVSDAFGKALNKVRVREHKELQKESIDILKGTRYDFLANADKIDGRSRRWFISLTQSSLQTARAWAIKEAASQCWNYISIAWAEKAWKKLIGWIDRCRIPEMKELAGFLKRNLWGMLNAIGFSVTNSPAESINSRIQKLKSRSCGFRNKQSFRETILFHLGGLDLYPRG